MAKKILVVVDTQYDFMMPDGKLPVPRAEEIIVPGIKFLGNLDWHEYAAVLFTYDSHNQYNYERSEEAKLFPIHCELGTLGWENVFNAGLIDHRIGVWTLEKDVFNMWENEDVRISDAFSIRQSFDRAEWFNQMKGIGVTQVEVMGVAADFCVKWAVDGLLEHGFEVTLIPELTRGIERSSVSVVLEDFVGKPVKMRTI